MVLLVAPLPYPHSIFAQISFDFRDCLPEAFGGHRGVAFNESSLYERIIDELLIAVAGNVLAALLLELELVAVHQLLPDAL